jgi:hypothetical protein
MTKPLTVVLFLALLTAVVAFAQVIVPCTHLVPLHPRGDVVCGPYGCSIIPCEHIVPLHPRGDIVY